MLAHFGYFCVSGHKGLDSKSHTAHLWSLWAEVGDCESKSVGYANPQQLKAWM